MDLYLFIHNDTERKEGLQRGQRWGMTWVTFQSSDVWGLVLSRTYTSYHATYEDCSL